MKGVRTSRNELIADFDPFELDKLSMAVAAIVGVALWISEAQTVWWIGAYAGLGLWMLQREAKVRAGVTHYHEERLAELERQVAELSEARARRY